jgi:hypothetical protein
MANPLADRTQQQAGEPAAAPAAQHDQLGVGGLGQQPGGRMADHRVPLDHQMRRHRAGLVGHGAGDALGPLANEVRVARVVPVIARLPLVHVGHPQRQVARAAHRTAALLESVPSAPTMIG